MLFSNALLFAIAGATVSAAVDVKLPEGWNAVEKRQQSPRANKLLARLAKRKANALDTTKIPPGSTYTYIDATTTITIIGSSSTASSGPTSTVTENPITTTELPSTENPILTTENPITTTELPSTENPILTTENPITTTGLSSASSSSDDGAVQTSTQVVATSCDAAGSCTTTTFVVGIATA